MTREEAIEYFKMKVSAREAIGNDIGTDYEAYKIALWMGCKYCDEEWGTCNPITNRFTMPPRGGIRFCPMCGRPLTDEAVQMVMERLEELKNES